MLSRNSMLCSIKCANTEERCETMQLIFYLEHQTLTMERPQKIIASHSQNYLTAKFVPLSDDWSGVVTVLFGAYQVALDENWECVVPWEALQQEGWVEVSAFCGDLHTSIKERFYVMDSGYRPGQTPQPPTPSVYLLLTGMAQTALDTANDVKQRADSGAFNGKDGAPGPMGPEGPKGQDGTVSFDALSEEQRESLRGKSAYAYAQDGGYTGTEEEFASKLAAEFLSVSDSAGFHNAVYRGKNLGSAVTPGQWAAIKAGTFKDLFIGDYWVINGVNWRIAAFDYYLNTGDKLCTSHHAVIVPDTVLYAATMNDTDTNEGAYGGSKMRTSGLNQAKSTINSAFGAEHILQHRLILANACTGSTPTGISIYDSTVELMSERQLFGAPIWQTNQEGAMYTYEHSQFPLFALNRSLLRPNSGGYWLRETKGSSNFIVVINTVTNQDTQATTAWGMVRPMFCIYQA